MIMKRITTYYLVILLLMLSCSNHSAKNSQGQLLKIEAALSAFGVESDHFPNITGIVDFSADSSYFYKSYYNPAYKASSYVLSRETIDSLHILINLANFSKLDTLYEPKALDLPASTLTFVWNTRKYKIVDNGLQGAPVLEKIYRLIYKY